MSTLAESITACPHCREHEVAPDDPRWPSWWAHVVAEHFERETPAEVTARLKRRKEARLAGRGLRLRLDLTTTGDAPRSVNSSKERIRISASKRRQTKPTTKRKKHA